MKKLGAYFQVYKNVRATDFVLNNFKTHFSDGPVYLLSDGGSDFSEIAKKYDCNYVYSFNNGYCAYLPSSNIRVLFERILDACKFCNTEYLMLLEEDVYVKEKFSLDNPFYIKGTKYGPCFSEELLQNIYNNGGKSSTKKYGMCGGSILHCEKYIDLSKKFDEFFLLHEKLSQNIYNNSITYIDGALTFLFNYYGYDFEMNPELSEVPHDPNWRNYKIISRFKKYYDTFYHENQKTELRNL